MLTASLVDNFCTLYNPRSVLHCNIRSLSKNFDVLCSFLAQHHSRYDIIAITETWLMPDECFNIPGYTFLSRPRIAKTRGGGVGLYIRNSITYKDCPRLAKAINYKSEFMFMELDDVVVGVVYRPPQADMNEFLNDLETVFTFLTNNSKRAVIMGDMNIDILGTNHGDYSNLLDSFGFQNYIDTPTRITSTTSTCLDHVLCNFESTHILTGVYETALSDHLPVAFLYYADHNTPVHEMNSESTTKIDFKLFSRMLSQVNFSDLDNMNANEHCHLLIETIKRLIRESSVTRRKTYLTTPICPWMTPSILGVIKKRDYWLTKMKQNKGNEYYSTQFRMHRNKAVALMRQQKKYHYCKQIQAHADNSKKLWSIINSIIRPAISKRVLPAFDNMAEASDVTDRFNNHFCTVGANLRPTMSPPDDLFLPTWYNSTFGFIDITCDEVISNAKLLKSGKAAGIDGIPVSLLQNNIEILAPTLTTLFNKAFHSAAYPEVLKVARVTPIYKSGDPNDLGNYRPISVLSCINSLFEKIFSHRIMQFLNKNNILSNSQHGFRKARSTTSAILSVSEIINEALNENHIAIGVFLDIKKAFDTVDHSILCKKLERYGFRGLSLKFLESYMTGRHQTVVIDNHVSTQQPITMGIPQGSVLGPILFSLYVNDIPDYLVEAQAIMYADDTALVVTAKSQAQAEGILNGELKSINNWFLSNRLSLNILKTKYTIFKSPHKSRNDPPCCLRIDNNEIQQVKTISYLGVQLDNEFNWKPHIDALCKKLSYSCFVLAKSRKYFDNETLRTLYFSIFQSHLSYCIESWGFTYKTFIEPVVKLQKRALRIINFKPPCTPSEPLFISNRIMPLYNLRNYRIALLVRNVISNEAHFPPSIFSSAKTYSRSVLQGKFLIPISHNDYGQRRLKHTGVKIWNEIPAFILYSFNRCIALKNFFMPQLSLPMDV